MMTQEDEDRLDMLIEEDRKLRRTAFTTGRRHREETFYAWLAGYGVAEAEATAFLQNVRSYVLGEQGV